MSIRYLILDLRIMLYRHVYGMSIGRNVKVSLKAKLDKTNPRGLTIGDGTYIAFGATILTHDMCRGLHADTKIGKNCFIGGNALILPGVKLGDEVIVAAGSVVTKDVKSNSIVAGNPAKFVKSVSTGTYGIIR